MSLTLNALKKLQQTGAFPEQKEPAENQTVPLPDQTAPLPQQTDEAHETQTPSDGHREPDSSLTQALDHGPQVPDASLTQALNQGQPDPDPSLTKLVGQPQEDPAVAVGNTTRLEREPPVTTEAETKPIGVAPDPASREEDRNLPAAGQASTQALLPSAPSPRATERFNTEPLDQVSPARVDRELTSPDAPSTEDRRAKVAPSEAREPVPVEPPVENQTGQPAVSRDETPSRLTEPLHPSRSDNLETLTQELADAPDPPTGPKTENIESTSCPSDRDSVQDNTDGLEADHDAPEEPSQTPFATLEPTHNLLATEPDDSSDTMALRGTRPLTEDLTPVPGIETSATNADSRSEVHQDDLTKHVRMSGRLPDPSDNTRALDLGQSLSLDKLDLVSPGDITEPESNGGGGEIIPGESLDLVSSKIETLDEIVREAVAHESSSDNTTVDSSHGTASGAEAEPPAFDATQTMPVPVDLNRDEVVTDQTYRDFYAPIFPALEDQASDGGPEPPTTGKSSLEIPIVAELVDSVQNPREPQLKSLTDDLPIDQEQKAPAESASPRHARSRDGVIPTGYERELIQKLDDEEYRRPFEQLRDRIYSRGGQKPGKFLLVSPIATERTADITAHLAVMFERDQREVLIVDANLDKQTLTRRFEALDQHGLCDALGEDKPEIETDLPTSLERLRFVPSGDDITGISRVPDRVQPGTIRQVLAEWTRSPRTVLCDVGAVDTALALPLAEAFDAVLMVVPMQDLNLDRVRDASKMLENRRVHMLGCIVTDA